MFLLCASNSQQSRFCTSQLHTSLYFPLFSALCRDPEAIKQMRLRCEDPSPFLAQCFQTIQLLLAHLHLSISLLSRLAAVCSPSSFSSLLWFCFHASYTIIISTLMHIPRYCFYCLSQSTSSFCIIDYFNGKDVYPPLRLSQLSSLIFSAHTSNEHFEAWYLADRCIYYWVYAAGIISAFRSSFFTWLGRKTMNNSTSKSPRSLWEKRGTAILSLLTSCMCDRFTCR